MEDTNPTNQSPADNSTGSQIDVVETDQIIDLTVFDPPQKSSPVAATPVHPLVSGLAVATLLFLVISSKQLLVLGVVGALAGMIFLHELGHFLAARVTNTKATEFFIGFGPRLWSFKRGETEYGIKAIPLGGYVKIIGMTNLDTGIAPEDEARTYRQASYPKRVLMASAGTMMHMLLAFVLFMVMFAGTGHLEVGNGDSAPVLNIAAGSPASLAGLQDGDEVIAMNGKPVATWDRLKAVVNSSSERPIAMTVLRNGRNVTTEVRPRFNGNRILIGVELRPVVITESIPTAARMTVKSIGQMIPQTFVSLKTFFAPSNLSSYAKTLVDEPKTTVAIDEAERNRMLSPVGATNLLSSAARTDFRLFLAIFATINVFVGIFNMMPILPLDGGHVLIATYERLRSRPKRGIRYRVDVRHWLPVTYSVMAIMLLLSLSSLYLDVRSPINIF